MNMNTETPCVKPGYSDGDTWESQKVHISVARAKQFRNRHYHENLIQAIKDVGNNIIANTAVYTAKGKAPEMLADYLKSVRGFERDLAERCYVSDSEMPATRSTIEAAEDVLGVTFGKQLVFYLKTHGYISYRNDTMLGIVNGLRPAKNDLVVQTLRLRRSSKKLASLVAVHDIYDGLYALVDSNDTIYFYDLGEDKLFKTEMHLFDYILDDFTEAAV